jgi:hypothetical protein
MVKKETLSENWDPGNLWTAQGVGHRRNEDDPSCKSGRGQGKLRQERLGQEPGRTRNQETMKVREETAETSRVQQRPKGHRPKTAAARLEANKRLRCQTAAMSKEEENNERLRRTERWVPILSGKRRNAKQNPI